MQSDIIFPRKNVSNWYTQVSDRPLGSGAFGYVYLLSDDRKRISDLQDIAEPNQQETHTLFKSSIDKKELKWNEEDEEESILRIMSVLSLYTWSSLYKLIMELTNFKNQQNASPIQVGFWQYIKGQKKLGLLSKYKMMHSIVQYIGEVDVDRVEKVVDLYVQNGRPQVAMKVNPKLPPLVQKEGMTANKRMALEKRQENATRTEVFALGSVSSEIYVEMKDDKVLEPLGCQTLLDAPIVSCLLDYFVDVTDGSTCLVTNYVHGYTLHKLQDTFTQRYNQAVALDYKFVWYVAWSMFHALQLVHKNHVIHNDIKLENIMYDTSHRSLILLDFGLSCHSAIGVGLEMEMCDLQGGTPMYASPEYAKGGLRSFASDMWALGVVLWEIATGQEYDVDGNDLVETFKKISRGAKPDTTLITQQGGWKSDKMKKMLDLIFNEDFKKRLTSTDGIAFIQKALVPFSSDDDPLEIGRWLKSHIGNPLDMVPSKPAILSTQEPPMEPQLKRGKVEKESMVQMPFMTP